MIPVRGGGGTATWKDAGHASLSRTSLGSVGFDGPLGCMRRGAGLPERRRVLGHGGQFQLSGGGKVPALPIGMVTPVVSWN
jgi:hypothetical protein